MIVNTRLNTVRAKEYVGHLIRTEDGHAIINTRVPGGVATIPISLEQISQLQVRRSVLEELGAVADPEDSPDEEQPETPEL